MAEITEVFRICFAYEQGVGTGQSSRTNTYYKKSMNPYRSGSPEHEAWDYGFDSGLKMNEDSPSKTLDIDLD